MKMVNIQSVWEIHIHVEGVYIDAEVVPSKTNPGEYVFRISTRFGDPINSISFKRKSVAKKFCMERVVQLVKQNRDCWAAELASCETELEGIISKLRQSEAE